MELTETVPGNAALMGLLCELDRGITMVGTLDDFEYAIARSGSSSIGAHFRHNLDFVNALLNGLAIRRIDYNDRTRDVRIETEREYAIDQLMFACRRLNSLTPDIIGSHVVVRSEVDEELWHSSTVSREIEFLHSHTVHHYALIKMLISVENDAVSSAFGVSPSTLRFRSASSVAGY